MDEDRSAADNARTNLDRPGPEDAACRLGPSSTPRSKDIRDDTAQLLHRNQLSPATTDSACVGHRALQSACHPPRFSHPSPKRTGHDKICSRLAFLWTANAWQLSFPSIGVAGGNWTGDLRAPRPVSYRSTTAAHYVAPGGGFEPAGPSGKFFAGITVPTHHFRCESIRRGTSRLTYVTNSLGCCGHDDLLQC